MSGRMVASLYYITFNNNILLRFTKNVREKITQEMMCGILKSFPPASDGMHRRTIHNVWKIVSSAFSAAAAFWSSEPIHPIGEFPKNSFTTRKLGDI